MKINFRKQKYHALVEMLLVADCVTRGHEVGRWHASKRYDHLRKKVLSHHKQNSQNERPDGDDPGFSVEVEHIMPALADIPVTPDGCVPAWPADWQGLGQSRHLGAVADLEAHLSRLGTAAELDQEEWAHFAAMVRSRLGMELGDLAGVDRP
jgi:hypothetical protein